jgi:hypothetical protein
MNYLLAEAAGTSPDYAATILQWGPGGVVLALLLSGLLITKGSHEDVKAERDRWRDAYEKERSGHELTREALADSSKSAAAAVETAKTTAALLTHLGHPAARSGTDAS